MTCQLDGHRISFLITVVGMNLHFLMENIFILQIEISFSVLSSEYENALIVILSPCYCLCS